MRPEFFTPTNLSRNHRQPPPRKPSWGQPPVDEPIIDAARISLKAFGSGRSRRRTMAMFLWLRVIRPALTLAAWFFAMWYAWPYVHGAQSKPEVMDLLILYAFVVSFILIFMLLIGPLRYLQRQREKESEDEGVASSLFALASYLSIPPTRLLAWQRTKQLVVRHNPGGQLEEATDSELVGLEVLQEAPLQSLK
jgi:poly-beta-1,6-N-acetyl-D-glucosamine biosynthesis protein PgaD